MTDQKLLLEPSPAPAPGWKQITGSNSSFPEPLLPRLAAPPRSKAQLQSPQDNGLGCGLNPVKRQKATTVLTKNALMGSKASLGMPSLGKSHFPCRTYPGYRKTAAREAWNYFLCVSFCVFPGVAPPLWQAGPAASLSCGGRAGPLCQALRRRGLVFWTVGIVISP